MVSHFDYSVCNSLIDLYYESKCFMKTVLILHYGGEQIRGSEVCLIHSIEALSENGFDVVILRKNK